MKNKKFGLMVACSLILSMFAVSSGAIAVGVTEDEQWPSQFSAIAGLHGFELDEVSGLRDNVSVLIGSDSTGQKICSSTSTAACSSSAGYTFRAVLGPCTDVVVVDCIEGVTGTLADGTSVAGVFKQYFPLQGVTDFVGSPSEGVPSGGPPSLWTMTGAPHAFGSDYEVTVQVVGSKVNGDALKPGRSFFASVTPVSIFQTTCDARINGHCMDTFREEVGLDGKTTLGFAGVAADQDAGIRCVNWGENGKCALKHAFPAGVKFALKIRLSTSPSGWLHGRMQDPVASIDRVNNVTTINIAANPTKVPTISGVGQWAELPTAIQESFTAKCANVRCGTRHPEEAQGGYLTMSVADRNIILGPKAFSDEAFELIKLWSGFLKETAAAMPSQWSVRTLSYGEMQSAPACIKNGVGVTGIVATNASAYSEGPPTFDSATSTLNYKVAALHFEKDGVTPFNGQYNLILRSDIANCLYGVSDPTAEASVSVSGEDGAAKAATTAFTYSNGWFSFSAKGFTHSAPTIKVRLLQKEVATTNPLVGNTKPTIYPKVKVGKTTTVISAAKKNGIKIPSGASVRVVVSSSSKKKCSVSGQRTVKALAKGTCSLSVYVTPKKTKAAPRPKTKRSTVKIVIS
jgi:hypothetical protein